jgi:tRNA threonylcarbamoyl adenosine modification protein YjeE
VVGLGHVVFSERGLKLDKVRECGHRLGRALRPGDLVFLEGPLGAGKTTFVRAVAETLEVGDPVRSPSFTIANIYSGRYLIQHLDLYRLEELADEDALALEEYVRPDAVTLVEWPESGVDHLGLPVWSVRLSHESLRTRSLEIQAATEDARRRWGEAGEDE